MNTIKLVVLSLFTAASLVACASGEEYEIKGEVTSATAVSGPIRLEFFEQDAADAEAERTSIKVSELAAPGAFTETVEVSEGSKLVVRALVDSDGDEKCTSGELWAEVEIAALTPDKAPEPVTLALAAEACPAE